MKTFSMWKLVNCIWAIITDGENTPEADSAAPKIPPARVLVSSVCDMALARNHLACCLKFTTKEEELVVVDITYERQIRNSTPLNQRIEFDLVPTSDL